MIASLTVRHYYSSTTYRSVDVALASGEGEEEWAVLTFVWETGKKRGRESGCFCVVGRADNSTVERESDWTRSWA